MREFDRVNFFTYRHVQSGVHLEKKPSGAPGWHGASRWTWFAMKDGRYLAAEPTRARAIALALRRLAKETP